MPANPAPSRPSRSPSLPIPSVLFSFLSLNLKYLHLIAQGKEPKPDVNYDLGDNVEDDHWQSVSLDKTAEGVLVQMMKQGRVSITYSSPLWMTQSSSINPFLYQKGQNSCNLKPYKWHSVFLCIQAFFLSNYCKRIVLLQHSSSSAVLFPSDICAGNFIKALWHCSLWGCLGDCV